MPSVSACNICSVSVCRLSGCNKKKLTVAEIFLCAIDDGAFPNPYFALNSVAATLSACM